ncbi:hypothetical protein P692DRAFT_20830510 [Suillus brevipes Sb2]|nr:hypothetical protein P692DRAFT_20830510 [Suillus brevipes Sb2]
MSDWSKLSSSVFSQASEALTEAKQRVSQALSEKDLDPQNIDWSKVSGDVLSRASGALTEARQLVNQAASQRDIDLQNVDWSKLSGNAISRASDALTDAKQLVNQAASQSDINLQNIDWSRLSGAKLWGSILSCIFFPFTAVNNWSIVHPYAAAVTLTLISASTNIGAFLTLSWLIVAIVVFLCLFLVQVVQLIIWCVGFRSLGVARGSLASRIQSIYYRGFVPRGSCFARLQSFGATKWPVPLTLVSLLSFAGVVIVLGREWGWWFQ